MRILIITKSFPPKIDGVGDYSFQLQRALQEKSEVDKVYIATSCQGSKKENKDFFYFDKWNINEFKALNQYIKECHIDCVLFQYVPYSFNKWGVPLQIPFKLKRLDIRLIIVFHEVRIKLVPWKKNFVIGLGQAAVAKLLYNIADKVITSNPFYGKLISIEDRKKKIHIIPVGSNLQIEDNFELIKDSTGDFIISSFGQSIRSYPLILTTAKHLLSVIPNLKILFIGALREEEIQQIKDKAKELKIESILKVTGRLDSNSIHALLKASDIYLMLENTAYNTWNGTSFRSGSLAAALQAGIRIIGCSGQLNNEVLKSCKGIKLLDDVSVETLKTAVMKFYNLSDIEKKLIQEDVQRVYKECIDWAVIGREVIRLMLQSNGVC